MRWRIVRTYYRSTWRLWRSVCEQLPAGRYRENALSVFGPLSLLGLFVFWITVLIVGFGLVQWGSQSLDVDGGSYLRQYLYHSGETFFTLGYGDVTPATYLGKFLAVMEAGTGFGFMAVTIGYLPVLYQAFSRREQSIALLDARAGSPPTASELFRRSGPDGECQEIQRFLVEWEAWAAELLESHLSFPVLSYYRSQHDNQSWLAGLAMVLDGLSFMVIGLTTVDDVRNSTFAMARHACVDLCLVFRAAPRDPMPERLTPIEMERAYSRRSAGHHDLNNEQTDRLRSIPRVLYEPFLQCCRNIFGFQSPRFFPDRSRGQLANYRLDARVPRNHRMPRRFLMLDDHFG